MGKDLVTLGNIPIHWSSKCRIRSIRHRSYYLFHRVILWGFYSRAAFIKLEMEDEIHYLEEGAADARESI